MEEILSVLITDTGNLTYHLVLAFSVAATIYYTLWAERRLSSQARRLLLGLSLLLALRVALFFVSSLVWQGAIDGDAWLPLLDRGATLLSILLIVWLWAFPEASPGADSATVLLSLLLLTLFLLGAVWWSDQGAGEAFNRSLPDLAAQAASIALLVIGALLLIARRPEGWVTGLIMLFILLAGHVVYLLLPLGDDQYPMAVRLAQIAAFPFLLSLPQRLPLFIEARSRDEAGPQVQAPAQEGSGESYPAAQVLLALQKVDIETAPERVAQALTAAVSKVMDADLCLLILPPDENNRLLLQCGYDRAQGRYLAGEILDARGVPVLVSALRMGRSRRLPASSATPDMRTLAGACGLERSGEVLYAPLLNPGGELVASLALLSPYEPHHWQAEDGAFLAVLGRHLVQFLQRSQEMELITAELEHERRAARGTYEQAQRAVEQNQKLRDQIAVLENDSANDKAQLVSMANIIATGSVAQEDLERLQVENEELRQAVRRATDAMTDQERTAGGEMRLALEEISHLRNSLSEADKRINMLKASMGETASSNEQLAEIVAIAQDLRGPLSSIVGYTDFLLSESVGILGASQRKYLERIRVSTERLSRLVNDLMQASSVDGGLVRLASEEVDLRAAIQESVSRTRQRLSEKNIRLSMDLASGAMPVKAEQGALLQVFDNLLLNASVVTPEDGEVNLLALIESSDGEQDYVLVQVTDSGGGLSPQDLPRVFAHRQLGTSLPGLGIDGDELSTVKALVEVFGGRIWVDSEAGQGATFSILLPLVMQGGEMPFMGDGA